MPIAITPDGKTAYVSHINGNTVTPIRIATNTALTPIPVGSNPWRIAITPDGRTAYVTHRTPSSVVTPIRIATNTALTPIEVGDQTSRGITITPDGRTAYVTSFGGSAVTPIRHRPPTPRSRQSS